MAIIPPEILFSTWAFVWTIVYYIVSNTHLSIPLDSTYEIDAKRSATLQKFLQRVQISSHILDPTVAISVALSFQLLGILVIVFRAKWEKLPSIFTKFILLTAVFKAGPLWLIWNPATFNLVKSTISFGVAFLVYLAYLYYRKLNLFTIYDDFLDSVVDDDNRIPPYYWVAAFSKAISIN